MERRRNNLARPGFQLQKIREKKREQERVSRRLHHHHSDFTAAFPVRQSGRSLTLEPVITFHSRSPLLKH